MKLSPTSNHLTAFVFILGASISHAFSPGFHRPSLSSPTTRSNSRVQKRPAETRRYVLNDLLNDEISITPEGYGFSTPTKRILKEAKRGLGYHRANGSDEVIDVMEAITLGVEDVALVFEEDKLLGIFTEADYVKVSIIPTSDSCNHQSRCLVSHCAFSISILSYHISFIQSSRQSDQKHAAKRNRPVICLLRWKITSLRRQISLPSPRKIQPISQFSR
jgi:hypothetical protein